MRRLVRSILDSRLLRGERGGAAIMMLMAFMVLAVPLSIAAVQTAGQLTRSSQVYDKRLTAQYNAGAGVEVAVYKVLSDPLFDDGLTPSSPSKVITADLPSDIVTITVTKIFSSASVAGQGLVVTKTVTPTTATAATLTTYTYTGKIKNEGSSAQQIMEITDFAPPGFTYVLGSTSGDITSNDPSISVGSAKVADYYLNHTGSGTSYPWHQIRGEDTQTGDHTPAQNVWEEIPEYWETAPYATEGLLRGTKWKQKQWIKGGLPSNKWRWKVELVRGGVPSPLFTSTDANVSTSWVEEQITHEPGNISILTGDKLRLHLEVYAPSSVASERLMEYRWGGYDNGPRYDSRTRIPQLEFCDVGEQYELQWTLSPNVEIQPLEELSLTFQMTATVPDGTYFNQVEVKYDPWWTSLGVGVLTRSPQTAPIVVGTGAPNCLHGSELRITQSVVPSEVDPGVPTEFTYTVNLENISPVTLSVCDVKDWLPATFTYVIGSPTGAIARDPDQVTWRTVEQRWELDWKYDEDEDFLFSIDALQTKSFTFKALATVEAGMSYANEVKSVSYTNASKCDEDMPIMSGGSSLPSVVTPKALYDVSAVAADGTILARFQLSTLSGLSILSWQSS